MRQRCNQLQQKCDSLLMDNKRMTSKLNEERERCSALNDHVMEKQIELKNLQDNYERLKYACTITDNQLTEIEGMLEAEQKRNQTQQEKIDKLNACMCEKDDKIAQLKQELDEELSQKKHAQLCKTTLENDIKEQNCNLETLQKRLISQQEQLTEHTNNLFAAQERIEVLTNETSHLQTVNEKYEREVGFLKEENARILSDLFYAKQESQRLQQELNTSLANGEELHAEIEELQEVLSEKENYYLQREIKSEATLAQHKKLIDYLQLKVEDLSQKKKLTLAEKLFGAGGNANSNRKENISPAIVEGSILYRTLQEELRREKQRNKILQEQIDRINGINLSTNSVRSPRKSAHHHNDNKQKDATSSSVTQNSLVKSPHKQLSDKPKTNVSEGQNSQHHFELTLQETNSDADDCDACKKAIIAGTPYWRCKECKIATHRKCRSGLQTACTVATQVADIDSDVDSFSLGKYSYEGKLDIVDDGAASCSSTTATSRATGEGDQPGTMLIFNVDQRDSSQEPLEVNCAYELEEQKILLLGCNTGLFALHLHQPQRFIHIAGIESVSCIAVSVQLTKAVLVGAGGESLYQCDFRQLHSRSQTATACVQTPLEASVLDLPFANRAANEKWQLVKISNEAENALDSVAIAATSTRIVIMKYDLKLQKFKPVRALDTATPVSNILFTRLTAIVSSDKFFEIDLDTYAAEEFVDVADPTLSHTNTCHPVVAICVSRQEFLLCFMECGVFVDEYGCRSRPYDLNWEYTPTGFWYREPFLYISHYQSVQVMRIHRSYTRERIAGARNKDADADVDDSVPELKRIHLPFYMPTLLADSGKLNAYTLTIRRDSGLQQIYLLDALKAFKQKFNESIETISSIATSITGSLTTTESTDG